MKVNIKSLITTIIAFILMSLGSYFLFFGNPQDDYLNFFIALLLISTAFTLLSTGTKRTTEEPEPETHTLIICKSCGFKEIRNFKDDDYIFKVVGNCPKCNSELVIKGIFVEKEEEKNPEL